MAYNVRRFITKLICYIYYIYTQYMYIVYKYIYIHYIHTRWISCKAFFLIQKTITNFWNSVWIESFQHKLDRLRCFVNFRVILWIFFAVRETASLGQQMLNAPFGINGLRKDGLLCIAKQYITKIYYHFQSIQLHSSNIEHYMKIGSF